MKDELKKLTISELLENFISKFRTFINSQINDINEKPKKIIDWLSDWIEYLIRENNIKTYHNYNRGSVVYVNFGFNIGNELGGAHYAIVLNNKDSQNSSLLTVVPMTSIKNNTKFTSEKINIGDELTKLLKEKTKNDIDEIIKEIDKIPKNQKNLIKDNYKNLLKKLESIDKIVKKINTLKQGSIIRVDQIKTISKLRILKPKYSKDFLGNIKISAKTLDLIDQKIKELFVK